MSNRDNRPLLNDSEIPNSCGGDDVRMIEKWRCRDDDCGRSFLVDMEAAQGEVLNCPYCCGKAESVANSNPEDVELIETLEGCLYPY